MGTDTLTDEQKQVKMVPESDLIAVKRGLESKIESMTSDHAKAMEELRKMSDGHCQNLLKEKSSVEELGKQLESLKPLPTKVQELQTLHEDTAKKLTDEHTAHTDLKRNFLKELYALPDEKLTGKSMEDLSTLEMGLKAAGIKPRTGGSYDMGSTGGGATTKTGVDLCSDEIAALKKKMGLTV